MQVEPEDPDDFIEEFGIEQNCEDGAIKLAS